MDLYKKYTLATNENIKYFSENGFLYINKLDKGTKYIVGGIILGREVSYLIDEVTEDLEYMSNLKKINNYDNFIKSSYLQPLIKQSSYRFLCS